jgi:hypothetical protein
MDGTTGGYRWCVAKRRVFIGAGVALAIVVALYVIGRDPNPDLKIERGEAAFPLRGSLADEDAVIEAALEGWKEHRGAAGKSKTARVEPDEEVTLLYAGKVAGRQIVVLSQRRRIIALHDENDLGWVVGGARDGFDAFDAAPVTLDNAILLPSGDWQNLPLQASDDAQNVDGLIAGDGELDDALVLETREPSPAEQGKLFDTVAGTLRIDAATHRKLLAAQRVPGRLTAVHAALGEAHDPEAQRDQQTLDMLWFGKILDAQSAVVGLDGPRALGLGSVDDPDGLISSAYARDLGSRSSPLGGGGVGAEYVEDDARRVLVVAGAPVADTLEVLAGDKRITRPGPVAVVPVDWDPREVEAVVYGRTKDGAVVAPLASR